jgi:hypothetical protein
MEDYSDTRIAKLREYLFDNIITLTQNSNFQINANFLSDKIDDYSLDKMPIAPIVNKLICGVEIRRDVFSFRSRKEYSRDKVVNLNNMGFFEEFEELINSNNERGVLPDIDRIESIKCLNPFTMLSNDNGSKAIFDIQIEIKYRDR